MINLPLKLGKTVQFILFSAKLLWSTANVGISIADHSRPNSAYLSADFGFMYTSDAIPKTDLLNSV